MTLSRDWTPTAPAVWTAYVLVARAWPELGSHRLDVLARHLGIHLKHHDALSDARAAGMVVVRAIEHTGVPLAQWLGPTARRRAGPAPRPAEEGPLRGERIAVLGQARDGPLACRLAAMGGRIVSSVGSTTTILAIVGEEPFGYLRYDAQFRRALDLQRSGAGIRILSDRRLEEVLA